MSITLWTVRPATDYQILRTSGVFNTAGSLVMQERLPAYNWMAEQLNQQVTRPNGITYPIWAWYRCAGLQNPKPDLRKRGHLAAGEKGVRIAFEIDESQVLLSNFDGWHAVLNDHCFSSNDAEYDRYETLEATLDKSEFEQVKKESWLRIFNLDLLDEPDTDAVQAVLWQLTLVQVKQVDFFTAR